MNILHKILGLLIFSFIGLQSHAQFVEIQDTAFAHAIAEKYPDIVNADTTQLDTVLAATKTGFFSISGRGTVQKIEELIYFKSIKNFNCKNNLITSIPDLSQNTALISLNISLNRVTVMPDVSVIPNLESVYITYNLIDSLIGVENHPGLKDVHFGNNILTSIPDFSTLPNLESISIAVNNLSWSDLMPITSIPDFNNKFVVFPQNELTPDTIISVREFQPFEISYPLDQTISGLSYSFQKDNTGSFSQGTDNAYVFNSVTFADAGIYEVFASSSVPEWSASLVTGETKLKILPCQEIQSVDIVQYEDCPLTGAYMPSIQLAVDGPEFTQYLMSTVDSSLTQIKHGEKVALENGIYNLYVTDGNLCKRYLDSVITITKSVECLRCDSLSRLDYSISNIDIRENYELELSSNAIQTENDLEAQWYKNGIILSSEASPSLVISKVNKYDVGVYSSQIKCPLASGYYTFSSDTFNVKVNAYQEIVSHKIAKNFTCETLELRIESLTLLNNDNRFAILVKNQNEDLEYTYTLGDPIYLPEGEYSFILTDNALYNQVIENDIQVVKPSNCTAIFSPNNDGESDEWYIKQEGPIQIVDKTGTKIVHLEGPCTWNGTDDSGIDLPIGIYSIIFPDNTFQIISLIR